MLYGQPFLVQVILYIDKHMFCVYNNNERISSLALISTFHHARYSMKIIHIADLHLGMHPDKGYPWSESRHQALWESLRHIIDVANEQSADLLLIAGDLFHRQPLLRDLKEVNALFDTLTTAQVVLIAGNHDHMGPRSHYRDFVWSDHVTMLSEAEMDSVYLEVLHTEVHGFSYHQSEIRDSLYDDLQAPGDGRIHILLGHGGDDRHIPIDIHRLAAAGFHYVALGHIHKPQIREDLRLAWCGSPEPTDHTDMGERGYVLADVTLRRTQLRFIPCGTAQYIPLSVTVTPESTRESLRHSLIRAMSSQGEENIYLVTLTGQRDADLDLTTPIALPQYRIRQWTDQTQVALDYDRLRYLHSQDLLGRFLAEISSLPDGPLKDKAMAYGTRACLQEGGRS